MLGYITKLKKSAKRSQNVAGDISFNCRKVYLLVVSVVKKLKTSIPIILPSSAP